jgi:hypothetical protein
MLGLPAFFHKAALDATHRERPTHHFHHIGVHVIGGDRQFCSCIH